MLIGGLLPRPEAYGKDLMESSVKGCYLDPTSMQKDGPNT